MTAERSRRALIAESEGQVIGSLGFFTVHSFDKFRFERVDPQTVKTGDIYVVRASENFDGFQKLTTISETNGYPQFNVLLKQ